MNDLFTRSWAVPPPAKVADPSALGGPSVVIDLSEFNEDVGGIEQTIQNAQSDVAAFRRLNDQAKTEARATQLRAIQEKADKHLQSARRNTRELKKQLEALGVSNEANRARPGCGPGSVTDRQRVNITVGLGARLRTLMRELKQAEQEVEIQNRVRLERRLQMLTGKQPDSKIVNEILSTGRSEQVLQQAVASMASDMEIDASQLRDAMVDIDERLTAVQEATKGMVELQQMFLDMATMVEAQGEHLVLIERDVDAAQSYVASARRNVEKAVEINNNTNRMYWLIAVLMLAAFAVILASVISPISSAVSQTARSAVVGVLVLLEVAIIISLIAICVVVQPLSGYFSLS